MSFKLITRLLPRLTAAALFLLPLVWMLFAALHPPGVPLPQRLQLLPQSPTLRNFVRVWDIAPLFRYSLNSVLIVTLAVPLTILTSSWAGFAIAQLPRAGQRRWVLLSLAILMVPGIALWMPRFLVYEQLNWLDSPLALIAPAWMGTSPFYVLMYYRAFRRIPQAIYDAARLDGAGILASWARVTMPMAWPTTVGVALLSFLFYWGDFISPLLYLRSEDHYTLPVALQLLQQLNRADWSLVMAAATIATLIPIAIFLLAQAYYSRVLNR
ncbi:MAG: carbohydrate ABC transporter permease [Ardenticatenaceae bacterium]